MGKLQNITLATAIAVLGLNTIKIPEANASVLSVGKYASISKKLKLISLLQKEKTITQLSQGNQVLISATKKASNDELLEQSKVALSNKNLSNSLAQSVNNFKSAKNLQQQVNKSSIPLINQPQLKKSLHLLDSNRIAVPINQNIQNRYRKSIETDQEIGLFEAEKILNYSDNEIGAEFNAGTLESTDEAELEKAVEVLKSQGLAGNVLSVGNESSEFPQPLFLAILLVISSPVLLMFIALGKSFTEAMNEGFLGDIKEKLSKPKVPEGSVALYNRSLKEITTIGNKAERINDNKFGGKEFLLLVQIKSDISKGTEGYEQLNNGVELLKAAIIAQKSFLRLEQTELRYRSRKQQEFYQYVADNLSSDDYLDKEAFVKKVKKKKVEVLPLITTEEGRDAVDSYVKEIKIISQYDLGLKLLSLFKQYNLQDFSILKNVSDVVETLEGKELISPKSLVSSVIENYEIFEKLAPILGISEAESSPAAYARILQVIGLYNRHGKAYLQFKRLVELLKQWEKPYKAIAMVRKEYSEDEYQLPPEMKQEIPGMSTYKKYAKYLACL